MGRSLMELLSAAPLAQTTGTVRFRGGELGIRALTARELEIISGVFPRPGAPYVARPGSNPESGPMIVNEQDPAYLRGMAVWLRKVRAMEIAASAGFTDASGAGFSAAATADTLRRWAEAAIEAVLGGASDGEILRVWSAVRDLSDPIGEDGGRIEAAKKALSALSPQELTQAMDWARSSCPAAMA